MKRFLRRIASTVLLLAAFPYVAHALDDSTEAIEAKKIVQDYFQALNESKLTTIVGLYHKESVFLPKNAPAVRGIEAITKAYRTLFEKARLNTEHDYHYVSVQGDIAIIESQGRGTLTSLDTMKAIPSNNKELFVLRRIDGKWKIDRYMFNDSEKQGSS